MQSFEVQNGILTITWRGEKHPLCHVDELQLKGEHNWENALAAALAAFLDEVPTEKIVQVLKSFKSVEHRIEFVRTVGGVSYYNDSKATNPEAAMKALATFSEPIILLAGGHDKNTDLRPFMHLVNDKVIKLILVGAAAERFYKEARANGFPQKKIFFAGYSMHRALEIAHSLAKNGDVVLLSPACASYDMYNGYEARGREYKAIVNALK